MQLLGIFHPYSHPSAALVRDGRVVSFVEEERLTRVKHAEGAFPNRAIRSVLQAGDATLDGLDGIVRAWKCPAYDSGEMAAHYDRLNADHPTTEGDADTREEELR